MDRMGYGRHRFVILREIMERNGEKVMRLDRDIIRRKALIQRIERAALNLKLSESDVAHRIELWRKAEGMTLDRIQKTLQACKNTSEPWGQNDLQLLQL